MTNNKIQKLRPPIKTHGGKSYLADWIIEHFPEDHTDLVYCEPFCGGCSVFLNKEPSVEEVICDIDKGTIAIFKTLRDEPQEFINKIKRIKYTEKTFETAQHKASKGFDDYVDHAVNEYVLRRMSRGGMKRAFAWSDRERGGQPGDVNAWKTMLKQLPLISQRLQNTAIVCENFFKFFKHWDEENTLFYIDPPYLPDSRTEGAQNVYEHELTAEDHVNLLHYIKNARGKVLISGYVTPLYNRNLKGWKCKKKNVANHSSQTKKKERRIEAIWFNY